MRLGARLSDWHSGNPRVRPLAWFGAFLGVVVLYVVAAALLGYAINGNGAPFLS